MVYIYSLGDVKVLISIGVHDWLGLNTLTVLLLNKAPLLIITFLRLGYAKNREWEKCPGGALLEGPYFKEVR